MYCILYCIIYLNATAYHNTVEAITLTINKPLIRSLNPAKTQTQTKPTSTP